MPRNPSSSKSKKHRTKSPYTGYSPKHARQEPARQEPARRKAHSYSNPLLFPGFQCKLAGLLLELGHIPENLSKIFKTEASLKSAREKTSNKHRIAAFLINEWVRQGQSRPQVKDFVDLFRDDHTKKKLLESAEETATEPEYTKCSKGPKSFKPIKLIITKEGKIIGICPAPNHGTNKQKSGEWCYYKSYNGDTNDESGTSISRPPLHAEDESIPPSCSSTRLATNVLIEFCEKIVGVLLADPNSFANAFLAVYLVSIESMEKIRELHETKRQRAERLHTELLRTVKSHENYGKFISVLKKEPVCAELLKIIPLSLSAQPS